MRTIRDMRFAGLIATMAAIVAGLVVSGLFHVATHGRGRLGWGDFNFLGVLEGIIFIFIFSVTLLLAKRAGKVTTTSLLSFGILPPSSARKLCRPVPIVENLQSFEGTVGVLVEGGHPVGVVGLADSMVLWEDCPVVSSQTAAAELGSLFRQHLVVFVADGETIHGVVSRDRFMKYLGA